MAEGPLVHYYALKLNRAFAGKKVNIIAGFGEKRVAVVKIDHIEAVGKQIRIFLSSNQVILIHLMMWGSWRFYRKGVKWDKDASKARFIIETDEIQAVAFSAPVVRFFRREELISDPKWGNSGPDPLKENFSREEFFYRLMSDRKREIGEALLDQKVIAGIGNILRIEVLFRSKIHPKREVGTLNQKELNELVRWILVLSTQWMKSIMKGKRTTWHMVYRRKGKPCPRCGHPIEFFRQAGRITYACPVCQK